MSLFTDSGAKMVFWLAVSIISSFMMCQDMKRVMKIYSTPWSLSLMSIPSIIEYIIFINYNVIVEDGPNLLWIL